MSKNPDKKIPNWLVIIAIVILIFLFFPIGSWFGSVDQTFVNEYNAKLEEANRLTEEHDKLINAIRDAKDETIRRKIEDYLSWAEKNLPKIIEFKSYIEINYKQLEKAGVNPDYVRDNVKKIIETMNSNEALYKTQLSITDEYEKLVESLNQ